MRGEHAYLWHLDHAPSTPVPRFTDEMRTTEPASPNWDDHHTRVIVVQGLPELTVFGRISQRIPRVVVAIHGGAQSGTGQPVRLPFVIARFVYQQLATWVYPDRVS